MLITVWRFGPLSFPYPSPNYPSPILPLIILPLSFPFPSPIPLSFLPHVLPLSFHSPPVLPLSPYPSPFLPISFPYPSPVLPLSFPYPFPILPLSFLFSDWLAGWLAGWRAGWLAGWLAIDGWLAGWLAGELPAGYCWLLVVCVFLLLQLINYWLLVDHYKSAHVFSLNVVPQVRVKSWKRSAEASKPHSESPGHRTIKNKSKHMRQRDQLSAT